MQPGEVLLRAADFNGPTGLVTGRATEEDLAAAAAMVAAYGKGQKQPQVAIWLEQDGKKRSLSVTPTDRQRLSAPGD